MFGQRRLRIHNLALSTSNGYGDIFRSCEINAIMNFFSKSSKLTFAEIAVHNYADACLYVMSSMCVYTYIRSINIKTILKVTIQLP